MRVVFLDRDGVINEFPGFGAYVTKWSEFRFLPGALEAIGLLTRAGYELHIISNQGCVSRGLISWEGLQEMTGLMLRRVVESGGAIAGVHYCPHRTEDACTCKKPHPELLWRALGPARKDLMPSALFVGDSREDIQAARSAGCASVLVLSGRTRREDVGSLGIVPDRIEPDLLEVARWLTRAVS